MGGKNKLQKTYAHPYIHTYMWRAREREGGKERGEDWRRGEEMKGGKQGEGRRERGTGSGRTGIGYVSVKNKTYYLWIHIYVVIA